MWHHKPVFIGLDLGTSSVKALAVDDRGRALAVEREGYPTYRARPGWAEQRADDWWRAAVGALRRLTERPAVASGRVEALGLSGQMHGALLLDRGGMPLRNALIWADERGQAELDQFAARLSAERVQQIAGSAPYTSATLAKLLWLRRHEPEAVSRAAHVVLAKDELRRRLTGDIATDPSDASGMLLYDVARRRWSAEILEAARIEMAMLPTVMPSAAEAGRLSADAAHVTGLPGGLPVATGGGDAACAAFGAGVAYTRDGRHLGLLSLGTAAQVVVAAGQPSIDDEGRAQTLCAVSEDTWLVMAALLAGGSALEWLVGATGARDASELLDEAASVPVGADGLLFLPHISGMRSPRLDPRARGVFVGISAAHGRPHLARAVAEGVAFALRDCVEVMRGMGLAPDELVCAGGPIRSAVWQRVLADALRIPLLVSDQEHGSALGAALLGMRAVGATQTAGEQRSEQTRRVVPDAQQADTYDRLFGLYQELYPALKATMSQLGDLALSDGCGSADAEQD